jgi:phosphoglycerate kinase
MIDDLRSRDAKVIVMSHLGRPKPGEDNSAYSLAPVAKRLGELLGDDVVAAGDTVGDSARNAVAAMADGDVVVLENVRFNRGETSKDDAERGAFADQLAGLADLYVGDGFGAVHRKHASVFDVPQRLPHAAGDLVVTETEVLGRLTGDPERPYVVVLGGSKVSDKLGVIDNLIGSVDRLLIGGGMVFTFLKARGHEVGQSLLEEDQVDAVREYLEQALAKGVEIVLPVDVVAATEFSADAAHDVVAVDAIPADRLGLDIGPESGRLFAGKIVDARTVFWNGPMGVFELAPFAEGTRAVAQAITEVSATGGLTVVGGGDSAAAVRALGFEEKAFGHISTGGGASLELLEGKALPGLVVLSEPEGEA